MKKVKIDKSFSSTTINSKALSKSGHQLYYEIYSNHRSGLVVEVRSTFMPDHRIIEGVYDVKTKRLTDIVMPYSTICKKPYGWTGTLILNEASIGCDTVSEEQSKFLEYTGADISYGKMFDKYRAVRVEYGSKSPVTINRMFCMSYTGRVFEVIEEDGFFCPPPISVTAIYSETDSESGKSLIKVASVGKRGVSAATEFIETIKSIIKEIR